MTVEYGLGTVTTLSFDQIWTEKCTHTYNVECTVQFGD